MNRDILKIGDGILGERGTDILFLNTARSVVGPQDCGGRISGLWVSYLDVFFLSIMHTSGGGAVAMVLMLLRFLGFLESNTDMPRFSRFGLFEPHCSGLHPAFKYMCNELSSTEQ